MTYGCIVYQEQVIRDFPAAGRATPWGRRTWSAGPSPRRRPRTIEKERQAFVHGDPERGITGCVANGIPEATAQAIYDEIFDFANYAFNKAHAVGLCGGGLSDGLFQVPLPQGVHGGAAHLACWTTPTRWRATSASAGTAASRCCRRISTAPMTGFTVEEEGIRFGLVAIKNIGRGFIQSVVREREQRGPFTVIPGLLPADVRLRRHQQAGGGEPHPQRRLRQPRGPAVPAASQVYETVLDAIGSSTAPERGGTAGLMFGGSSGQEHEAARIHLPDIPEYSATERMHMEKETTGLYLSGHPMDGLAAHGPAGEGQCLSTRSWTILPARTGLCGSPTGRTSPWRAS